MIHSLSLGTATICAAYEGLTGTAEGSVIEGNQEPIGGDAKIILLHHSTGDGV